jgi:hypothetical protein
MTGLISSQIFSYNAKQVLQWKARNHSPIPPPPPTGKELLAKGKTWLATSQDRKTLLSHVTPPSNTK